MKEQRWLQTQTIEELEYCTNTLESLLDILCDLELFLNQPSTASMAGYSPSKDHNIPILTAPTYINNPPSPRTHRALRRLQSAHNLGQANNQPSLIAQQHKESLARKLTPATTPGLQHHTRGRSNSDASNMTAPSAAIRRPVVNKRPIAADALSLDRLIREGPPDGDIIGALESTRLKILDQGIKSDSDGMVCVLVL